VVLLADNPIVDWLFSFLFKIKNINVTFFHIIIINNKTPFLIELQIRDDNGSGIDSAYPQSDPQKNVVVYLLDTHLKNICKFFLKFAGRYPHIRKYLKNIYIYIYIYYNFFNINYKNKIKYN